MIVEDDPDQPVTVASDQMYLLSTSCSTLDAIDDAVAEWRKKALPDIEKDQRLTAYRSNHAHEIIDYKRRQQAGKPIGIPPCRASHSPLLPPL